MPKKIALLAIVILSVTVATLCWFRSNTPSSFFCESNYSVVQQINSDHIRSEGLISAELSDNALFINIDGLLIKNEKKYILSRSINVGLKKYNSSFNLYLVTSLKTSRDNSDNIPNDIAQELLFGDKSGDRIIYIDRISDDTILFGNQMFPQYGCRRK
ncbi:hypothetical protein [Entomohabitans teleogrylli]|uniref:hypothetical protein n=1 Tax=Entomohabitans teleogrylli TaxID=1384589 RepID=UPI00073D6421|nr:hypothetical protein [Entomohabitans teleogrylli]